MTYEPIFSARALKDLGKLAVEMQERITVALERMRIRPHRFVVRLVGSTFYRLRVGEYRVILDIIDKQLLIVVIEREKRGKVYKRKK